MLLAVINSIFHIVVNDTSDKELNNTLSLLIPELASPFVGYIQPGRNLRAQQLSVQLHLEENCPILEKFSEDTLNSFFVAYTGQKNCWFVDNCSRIGQTKEMASSRVWRSLHV